MCCSVPTATGLRCQRFHSNLSEVEITHTDNARLPASAISTGPPPERLSPWQTPPIAPWPCAHRSWMALTAPAASASTAFLRRASHDPHLTRHAVTPPLGRSCRQGLGVWNPARWSQCTMTECCAGSFLIWKAESDFAPNGAPDRAATLQPTPAPAPTEAGCITARQPAAGPVEHAEGERHADAPGAPLQFAPPPRLHALEAGDGRSRKQAPRVELQAGWQGSSCHTRTDTW